ncbi:hypothetical protein C7S18_19885 [Ahniella affigens]|uniref:Uncharacterized protein n=1 Tax=Ahniella affigens TaxID=2021234 RepID=A0A2P1PWQ5_9GAMM|nr:hypothetical protein [Ahniella affigens]AVP99288.1 hypothetical protein C7S18_19885 [Ahniella affigens]
MKCRSFRVWLVALFALTNSASAEVLAMDFSDLRSAERLPYSWDYYSEIEHKGVVSELRMNTCLKKSDLLKNFPVGTARNYYWNYVAAKQQQRNAKLQSLGSIDGIKISEILITFSEPVDFVKILAFSPVGSKRLCPFMLVSEWEWLVRYSPSSIVNEGGQQVILTALWDEVAFRVRGPMVTRFVIESGRPKFLSSGPN